jgi:hypothetical protein
VKTRSSFALLVVAGLLLVLACLPVDTQAPSVTIVQPANGSTVAKGNVLIKAHATDNKKVTKVEFSVNDTLKGTDNVGGEDTFRYTWDASAAAAGSHTIKAKAYDAANNNAEHSVTVTVSTGGGGGGSIHRYAITGDSIWYPAGNPHIIDANIDVKSSGLLTIMPGCTVKFNSGNELRCGRYSDPGGIRAIGKADSTILFTSNVGTPGPGNWDDIGIYGAATGNTQFAYCTFEYGGGTANWGAIYVTGSAPRIDTCTVRNSGDYGFYLEGGAHFTSFTDNVVTTCLKYPVHIEADQTGSLGPGNTFRGNASGKDAIEVTSDQLTQSQTWLNHGVPYLVIGDVDVCYASSPILTLSAGDSLKIATGVEIEAGHYSTPGAITAVGTAGAPIVFTTPVPNPQPGDHWDDIGIYDGATSATRFNYCIFEYGGANANWGEIYLTGSSPRIDNCTIRHSGDYGLYVEGGAHFASFTNNTVTTCLKYPIHIEPEYVKSIGTPNSLVGNDPGYDGIEVLSGTVHTTATWLNEGVPYVIVGDIDVSDPSASPTLTIAPGNTIKLRNNTEFKIGHYTTPGGLIADGTSGRITFTTATNPPSSGLWQSLSFYDGTLGNSKLVNCTIEYGGNSSGYGDIYICNTTAPVISGDSIRHSLNYGILLEGTTYPNPDTLLAHNFFGSSGFRVGDFGLFSTTYSV